MNPGEFIRQFNLYTQAKKPFVFLIDFEKQKPELFLQEEAEANALYFSIDGKTNYSGRFQVRKHGNLMAQQIDFQEYNLAFNQVQTHLKNGDTYLLNLTFQTPVSVRNGLLEIFEMAQAKYKLWFRNQFVCFSPESFIKIRKNKIYTYPMKGTIKADVTNAKSKILADKKEAYEHNTIVDLLRNDLSMVAKNIEVDRYRYVEKIATSKGDILQVSSQISGELYSGWEETAGELFYQLLPAGSISGAPKTRTVEIIKSVEKKQRNYYTGIFGLFDGANFDSAVIIRYIENINNQLFYRSGGGITALSNSIEEYDELNQKIYVPLT